MHWSFSGSRIECMKIYLEWEAAELLATTKVETETTIAAARLEKVKVEATAQMIISNAEGIIAPWVERKKKHETMVKEVEVYERLANNDDLVICGAIDHDTNLVAVADAILQNADASRGTRSAIVTEMALLGRALGNFSKKDHQGDRPVTLLRAESSGLTDRH
jgi:hypothetical protein